MKKILTNISLLLFLLCVIVELSPTANATAVVSGDTLTISGSPSHYWATVEKETAISSGSTTGTALTYSLFSKSLLGDLGTSTYHRNASITVDNPYGGYYTYSTNPFYLISGAEGTGYWFTKFDDCYVFHSDGNRSENGAALSNPIIDREGSIAKDYLTWEGHGKLMSCYNEHRPGNVTGSDGDSWQRSSALRTGYLKFSVSPGVSLMLSPDYLYHYVLQDVSEFYSLNFYTTPYTLLRYTKGEIPEGGTLIATVNNIWPMNWEAVTNIQITNLTSECGPFRIREGMTGYVQNSSITGSPAISTSKTGTGSSPTAQQTGVLECKGGTTLIDYPYETVDAYGRTTEHISVYSINSLETAVNVQKDTANNKLIHTFGNIGGGSVVPPITTDPVVPTPDPTPGGSFTWEGFPIELTR